MLISQFLQQRKSIRDYKWRNVRPESINEIKEVLLEMNIILKEYNISLELIEDGEKLYGELNGKAGYNGVMIKSPSYIALNVFKESEEGFIYGAYYAEVLTSILSSKGLGSCWVTLSEMTDEEKEAVVEGPAKTEYLLAFGYPIAKATMLDIPFSTRLGVEDIVFDGKTGEPIKEEVLEQRGLEDVFYFIRFAPSSLNKQPWRFYVEDDKITLKIADYDSELQLIDAGIIIFYLENMIRLIGLNKSFNLELSEENGLKTIGFINI